ncbi:hypothetical protein C8J57DRAFT_1298513 [Mycena rebaudengoi]|nr:hypothetical protein C8J57DRAFT_1298513 [Mycena rebaudengoi]
MCGRFALRLDAAEIQQLNGYDVSVDEWERRDAFIPRYNIAPHSQAPVIRRREPALSPHVGPVIPGVPSDPGSPKFVMSTMRWGLVPNWTKFEDKSLNTTNTRSENLVEGGGMWGSIKGPKRCAVVCQGYYEWLTKGKNKLPHFIKPKDGRLMLMAGLWDSVVLQGETETLWTFTIVTTAASKGLSWLHDRQPVILSTPEALDMWLDTSSHKWSSDLNNIVVSPSCPLECYQVPKEVGRVGTESSTFIEPVANRKDGIQAMFTKQKEAQTSPKKITRKRSPSSDTIEVVDTPSSSIIADGPSSSKKPKRKHAPTVDDDSDIEIIDGPSPKKKPNPQGSSTLSKITSSPKKKKKPSSQASSSPTKITSFLTKSS